MVDMFFASIFAIPFVIQCSLGANRQNNVLAVPHQYCGLLESAESIKAGSESLACVVPYLSLPVQVQWQKPCVDYYCLLHSPSPTLGSVHVHEGPGMLC
jgi:hypothetical protein